MATSNQSQEAAIIWGDKFAVHPKNDCPHVETLVGNIANLNIDISLQCADCKNIGENWLCLKCSEVYCSRYVQSHMVQHRDGNPMHMIALSFSDLSFWCYECDSYIVSPHLKVIYEAACLAKFDTTIKNVKPKESFESDSVSEAARIRDKDEKDGQNSDKQNQNGSPKKDEEKDRKEGQNPKTEEEQNPKDSPVKDEDENGEKGQNPKTTEEQNPKDSPIKDEDEDRKEGQNPKTTEEQNPKDSPIKDEDENGEKGQNPKTTEEQNPKDSPIKDEDEDRKEGQNPKTAEEQNPKDSPVKDEDENGEKGQNPKTTEEQNPKDSPIKDEDEDRKEGQNAKTTEEQNPKDSPIKDGDKDRKEQNPKTAKDATTNFHLKSTLPKEVLLSRMRAVIYGNCIGDAIGLLTEFMTKEEAEQIYGETKKFWGLKTVKIPTKDLKLEYNMKHDDFHRSRWEVGDWTDDSDQMILILRTLVDKNGKADYLDFVKKFRIWTETGYKELGDYGAMGIGRTTFNVILQKDFFKTPHKCARQVWEDSGKWAAPNGGVMRTSILGIQDFSDIPTVIENTQQICKVTHADPRCIASCVAVTTAIALMLQGKHCKGKDFEYDVKSICEQAYEYACQELETKKEKEELRKHMFANNLAELELSGNNEIGYTYKCLGAGFWAFRQHDFRMAMTELVMEAGDADTNGAVAGALLGCKLGVEYLPDSWLENLLHKKWLEEEMDRYFSMLGFNGK